uniref:Uncharacterized protein n=1 Tax=Globodera rostochiensis TaxID=31243 RepID=A0A914I0S8_GLORO
MQNPSVPSFIKGRERDSLQNGQLNLLTSLPHSPIFEADFTLRNEEGTGQEVSSFLPINAFILFVCDVWKKVKDKFGTLNGLLLCHGIDHKQLCGYLKAGKCPFWHIQNIL